MIILDFLNSSPGMWMIKMQAELKKGENDKQSFMTTKQIGELNLIGVLIVGLGR